MSVKKSKFKKINGMDLDQVFTEKRKNLKSFGLIEEDEDCMKLTDLGAFVADEVAQQFNSAQYIPFEKAQYSDGALNPYNNNAASDAFGE